MIRTDKECSGEHKNARAGRRRGFRALEVRWEVVYDHGQRHSGQKDASKTVQIPRLYD